eukprot:5052651-Karenia_brevis.AAC.1
MLTPPHVQSGGVLTCMTVHVDIMLAQVRGLLKGRAQPGPGSGPGPDHKDCSSLHGIALD